MFDVMAFAAVEVVLVAAAMAVGFVFGCTYMAEHRKAQVRANSRPMVTTSLR